MIHAETRPPTAVSAACELVRAGAADVPARSAAFCVSVHTPAMHVRLLEQEVDIAASHAAPSVPAPASLAGLVHAPLTHVWAPVHTGVQGVEGGKVGWLVSGSQRPLLQRSPMPQDGMQDTESVGWTIPPPPSAGALPSTTSPPALGLSLPAVLPP